MNVIVTGGFAVNAIAPGLIGGAGFLSRDEQLPSKEEREYLAAETIIARAGGASLLFGMGEQK